MKAQQILTCLFLVLANTVFAQDSTLEPSTAYFALAKPASYQQSLSMTIVNKSGQERLRKLIMFSSSQNNRDDSLIEFLEPRDVAGTKFLSTSEKGRVAEQRLYLPSLKKIRRIASSKSSKEESFMGSDFSNYDLEERYMEDYQTKTLGKESIDGQDVYAVEWIPKDPSAPYGRLLAYLDQALYFPLRIEYFNQANELVKTLNNSNIENIQGFLFSKKQTMKNEKTGSYTILVSSNIDCTRPLDRSVFSIQNLSK